MRAFGHDPMTAGARDDDALARAARLAFAAPLDADPGDDDGELALRTFGDYELLDVLGAGGMGVVYRARHRVLEREVALKIIAEDARNDDSGALFLDEARNAARLNHPNIVPVHDVGTRGGLHYFSMQLVDGEHLGRRIARGVLDEREAIALLLPVCDALDYAHRLGVLHLDLKPANILIDTRGAPLVADFGLARRVGADGTARARDVSGTPAYMAPEQLQAESGRLTFATDVYSLGAVLYEALAGISPHGRGDASELAARALAGNIAPLSRHRPGVSPDVAAVCRHCLAHDPAQRYASVAALADDLRRIRDGLPVSVRRRGRAERLRAWLRREPRFATALATALIATVAGAVASGVMWQRTERARERAALSAELGARLFVRGGGEYDGRAGHELVAWLQERLPDDPVRRSAVLADYFAALKEEDAGVRRLSLRWHVLAAFGSGLVQQVIERLKSRGDARSLLYAAMLEWNIEVGGWNGVTAPGAPARFPESMQAALAAAPDAPATLAVAAAFCARRDDSQPMDCPVPGAARRFVELDPGNAWAWVLLAAAAAPGDAPGLIHEAAQRRAVNDFYVPNHAGLSTAFAGSGVPVPPEVVVVFAGRWRDPLEAVGWTTSWSAPDTAMHRIGWLCDPARNPDFGPGLHADCRTLALVLVAARGSTGTNMLGSAMIRRLEPGSALAARMVAERRVMLYRRETLSRMRASEPRYPQFTQDTLDYGEIAAMGMMLERNGYAPDPPPDWQPNDPVQMELPENRPRLR